MKTSLIKAVATASGLASLAILSAVPAMAEGSYDNPASAAQSIQSTKTRAEVRAEYDQAVKDSTRANISAERDTPAINFTHAATATSTLTRDAVRADTIEWLRLSRGDVQMGSR